MQRNRDLLARVVYGKSLPRRFIGAIAVCLAILSTRSVSAEIIPTAEYAVGNFCLSGLPKGVVTRDLGMVLDTIHWERININVRSSATTARLTVYDAPVDWARLAAVDCAIPPAGRHIVLAGHINNGHINILRANDPKIGARVQIDPDAISLELGNVTVEAQPVLGGTVSFKNRLVWLYNKEGVEIQTGNQAMGGVLMEVTDIAIRDLKLRWSQGAEPTPVTVSVSGKNVKFQFDLSSGSLSLYEGTLWANQPTLPATTVNLAGLAMKSARLTVNRLEITGDHTRVLAALSGVTASAPNATHGPAPLVNMTLRSPLSATLVRASIPHSAVEAEMKDMRLTEVKTRADLTLIASDGQEILNGTGDVNLQWMTDAALQGGVSLSPVTCTMLSQVIPGARLPSLDLSLQGNKDSLTIAGNGGLPALQLGELTVGNLATTAKNLTFGPGQWSSALMLPFRVTAGASPASSVSFYAGDSQVTVSGQLKSLTLAGSITLGSDLQSLAIDAGGLDIAMTGAASVTPVLFGAKPSFAQAEARVRAGSRLVISKQQRTGSLLVESNGVILPSPELFFDLGGIRLNAPLKTDAAVAFDVDLGTGAWRLDHGSLEVTGINARTIGETPLALDALQLEGAELSLDQLVIKADSGKLSGTGTGLSFAATKISHGGKPPALW
ncbi:MAG TPA: hypothetical protein VH988_28650 [Thermoanaerobaculia bacterium]|jgi:hypothetical protein|nr:hypothetical protein [Thermoanaerobaculia bacterium]